MIPGAFLKVRRVAAGSLLVACLSIAFGESRVTHQRGEERLITVTAKPEFREGTFLSQMILPALNGHEIAVDYSGEGPRWLAALPKDKEVTFTYWIQIDIYKIGQQPAQEVPDWPQIDTIVDHGTVLYDAAICPLHHVRMERADVEILYRLPTVDFVQALQRFSGGPGFRWDGPPVSKNMPKTERGYRCVKCVEAYAQWQQQTAKLESK